MGINIACFMKNKFSLKKVNFLNEEFKYVSDCKAYSRVKN